MNDAAANAPGAQQDIALSVNAGSSTLKFALFKVDASSEESLATGLVEGFCEDSAHVTLKAGEHTTECAARGEPASAMGSAFELLARAGLPAPTLVGHRVVHGGSEHVRPALIDTALVDRLTALVPLAPLHLPAALLGIRAVSERFPKLAQVACFDTAFHASVPEIAQRFALPSRFYDAGVRRYGFHGLSYEYVLSALGEPPPARVIIAHLGNGASVCAVKHGLSIDTSMGFTPTGGIIMGTRSGDLDPGVIVHLLREKATTSAGLEQLLNHESGLAGIAGTSDMKTLVARAATDPRADLAISMFAYSVRKTIGAYVAALGGLDVLVFTGGIGEHVPLVRARSCAELGALGIELDGERNSRNDPHIQAPVSRCAVRVIATDEDRMVARHARRVVRA